MQRAEDVKETPEKTRLNMALALLPLGFKLFPIIANGKKPTYKEWQKDASNNQEIVGNTWSAHPEYNIGIQTGAGLLVVDIDMKSGKKGLQSLDALQHEHGQLHDTLTAKTPTGGLHLYFRYDASRHNLGNRTGIKDGIDTRADGGYVVAPGSSTPQGDYAWRKIAKIADAPSWLLALSARREDLIVDKGSTIADTIPQIAQAIDFIKQHPPAIEGQNGDQHTYLTACRLKDMGLSAATAFDVMLHNWNARCQPPWDVDELQSKIHNAYAYGANAQGSHTAEAMFEDDETVIQARAQEAAAQSERAQKALDAIRPKPITEFKPSAIPPRKWVLGSLALEGKITVLISPGGVGKSTLTLNAALAVATGREDIMQMAVRAPNNNKPAGAWVFNNEDDTEELHRRLFAAMQHHDISANDLHDDVTNAPRLFINSGEARPFMVSTRVQKSKGQFVHVPADADAAIAHIKANNIKLFVVDPFVETHEADENDNVQIAAVGRIYRRIAQEAHCAVVLVHHTRKPPAGSSDGYAGDADSGRGAGALMALARVGVTLYGMSEKDARTFRLPPGERWRYVRLDDAKANLSPLRGDEGARWFMRESVEMVTAGADGALGGDGGAGGFVESVGVLTALEGLPVGSAIMGVGETLLGETVASVLKEAAGEMTASALIAALQKLDDYSDVGSHTLRTRLRRAFVEGKTPAPGGNIVRRVTAGAKNRQVTFSFEPDGDAGT